MVCLLPMKIHFSAGPGPGAKLDEIVESVLPTQFADQSFYSLPTGN
jgi:hypothetical protein